MPTTWNDPGGPLEGFEALTEELISSARIAVLVLDADAKIVHFNACMEQVCGYKIDEVVGRDWFEAFIPEEHEPRSRKILADSISGNPTVGNITPILAKDGTRREIEWFDRGLKNKDGENKGLLVMGRDVTAELETQTRLQDSEERASAVMETAVNAIITMGESRLIRSVNSAAEKMFGYSADEMVGQNVNLLMPSPYREAHDGYVKDYVTTGKKKIIGIGREVAAQHKDGTVFPVDLSVGEAQLQDGSRLFTGILRDLSPRKRLEEKILEISEEEQRRIGRDIHDDLCQQLAGIGCLAQVIQKRLADEGSDVAGDLAEIVHLVSDANARAREMSRGLVPVIRESDGLASALSDLAVRTRRMFAIDCDFTSPRPVFLDDNKLATQVFRIAQEAVSNACRHSGAHRIDIILRRDVDELVLTVADNGKGISDEGEPPKGLGLLTMDHRTKMLGGQLKIASALGMGTEVCCRVQLGGGGE